MFKGPGVGEGTGVSRLVAEALGGQIPWDLVGHYVDCGFDSGKGRGGVRAEGGPNVTWPNVNKLRA